MDEDRKEGTTDIEASISSNLADPLHCPFCFGMIFSRYLN